MPLSLPLLALLTVVALGGDGCGQPASSPASLTDAAVTTDQQPFTRLASAITSGFSEPAELIVRDDAALASAWLTLHNGLPGVSPPKVDFSRSSVVLIAMGQRPNGGYAVRFDGIGKSASGAAVVRYTVTSPGPQCMTAQMISAPVDIVSVPRLAGPIQFERKDAVDRC